MYLRLALYPSIFNVVYALIIIFNLKKLMFVIRIRNRLIKAIGGDFSTRGSLSIIMGNQVNDIS